MITVQIGNTDDKLTQREWSQFFHRVDGVIRDAAHNVYFSGHALPAAPWQNGCWCFDVNSKITRLYLERVILTIAKNYRQESVAWTEGETDFLLTSEVKI